MIISAVTLPVIKDYCGLTDSASDTLLGVMQAAAVDYIKNQTGLTDEELDDYEDLTIALLVLISDMYLNRVYAVDKSNVNPIAYSIIAEHCQILM